MNNALRRKPKKQLCALGKAINFYQIELGYSDYYLAQLMFSNASNIAKHKLGTTIPRLDKFEHYAKTLKVSPIDLMAKKVEIENELR